jgi:hypothetical protein
MTGRSNYRGGRGGRGGKPQVQKPQEPKKNKSIEDYYFYVGSRKQASDFETTSELLVNYVKKTFDRGKNVAKALHMLEPCDTDLWKPALAFNIETDVTLKGQEARQYELEYKADLDKFMRRRRAYSDNLFKAYALIWEHCAKAMQNKIMAQSDFESNI